MVFCVTLIGTVLLADSLLKDSAVKKSASKSVPIFERAECDQIRHGESEACFQDNTWMSERDASAYVCAAQRVGGGDRPGRVELNYSTKFGLKFPKKITQF